MKRKSLILFSGLSLVLGLALLAGCGKKEEEQPAAAPAAASAPAPAATPIDPATAASVSGTVKLDGAAPKAAKIDMSQDPACKGTNMAENVVAANGDLANVFVYVKEGLGNRTFDVPKDAITLDQSGCKYHPHVMGVMAGQTVKIVNSDPTTHNIHPTPKDNREWNESQSPGAPAINQSFPHEEIAIPVKCNIHPWMKGYIAVFDHPYFTVTGKDGSFDLKNVPPGNYMLVAWHELYGTNEQPVTIGPMESKTLHITFHAASAAHGS